MIFIPLLICVLFPEFVWAQSARQKGERTAWEEDMIKRNTVVSEWFDSAAEGLDLFLVGNRRVTTKRNETQFTIENTTLVEEAREPNNTTSFSMNLRLPNVEKYWALKFTSYDEQREARGVRGTYLRQVEREENYGASVGLFQKIGNIRVTFEPRIQLEDPLKVSHSLEFESVADMEDYRINPKLEFFANPTQGVGTFQALNINFYISERNTITLINQAEYEDKSHLLRGTHGISLGHTVNPSTTILYTALIFSDNRPRYKADSYNLSVAWNQVLYKKVLDYQIIPNIDFARGRSFKGLLGMTFNVKLHF